MNLIEIEENVFFNPSLKLIEQETESRNIIYKAIEDAVKNNTYDSENSNEEIFVLDNVNLNRFPLLVFNYESITLDSIFKIRYKSKFKHKTSDSNWDAVGFKGYSTLLKEPVILIEKI